MTRQATKRKKLSQLQKNEAVTVDGAPYNKRQRPDNWSALQVAPSPPRNVAVKPESNEQIHTPGPESTSRASSEYSEPMDSAGFQESAAEEESAPGFKYEPEFDRRREKPRMNQTYGQASAFPGLDEEDYDYEEGEEAEGLPDDPMQYLRMVRAEANNVPIVVAAPKPAVDDIYETGFFDTRGYYEDGAYVSAPMIGPELPPEVYLEEDDPDDEYEDGQVGDHMRPHQSIEPQEAYEMCLAARYRRQRDHLQRPAPAAAVAALSPTQHTVYPTRYPASKKARKDWIEMVNHEMPHPAQVSLMNSHTVLKLLGLITGLLKRDQNITTRQSVWIWALLSKLGDASCLYSEDVGVMRDLVKTAIWMRCGWLDRVNANEPAATETNTSDSEEDTEFLANEKGTANGHSKLYPPGDAKGNTEPQEAYDQVQAIAADVGAPDAHEAAQEISVATSAEDDKQPGLEAAREALLARLLKSENAPQLQPLSGMHNQIPTKAEALSRAAAADEDTELSDAGQGAKTHETLEDDDDIEWPNSNTRATIDMIVMVVGEMFGQRDFLRHREMWSEDEGMD